MTSFAVIGYGMNLTIRSELLNNEDGVQHELLGSLVLIEKAANEVPLDSGAQPLELPIVPCHPLTTKQLRDSCLTS